MIYDLFDFLDDSERFPSCGHFSQEPPQMWMGLFSEGEPMYDGYSDYQDDEYDYTEGNW